MKSCFRFLFYACCITLIFSSCAKEYSNESGNYLQDAEGSLKDSTGNCLPDTVIGTFYNGITPGTDTAYVEVEVNVTKTGSYNISSDYQNGFEFVDSGFFTSTGLTTIKLKPFGTPILPKATVFNISFDSSFCNFTVTVQDSTGTGIHSGGGGVDTTGSGDPDAGTGNWQFTQGSANFAGALDSAKKDNSSGAATFVKLNGSTSTGDTTMSLLFSVLASDIQPGTYTLTSNTISFAAGDALNDFSYSASPLPSDAGTDFTIVVTSYDASTQVMKGTFSGKVKDNKSGSIIPITNGAFTATVQ